MPLLAEHSSAAYCLFPMTLLNRIRGTVHLVDGVKVKWCRIVGLALCFVFLLLCVRLGWNKSWVSALYTRALVFWIYTTLTMCFLLSNYMVYCDNSIAFFWALNDAELLFGCGLLEVFGLSVFGTRLLNDTYLQLSKVFLMVNSSKRPTEYSVPVLRQSPPQHMAN